MMLNRGYRVVQKGEQITFAAAFEVDVPADTTADMVSRDEACCCVFHGLRFDDVEGQNNWTGASDLRKEVLYVSCADFTEHPGISHCQKVKELLDSDSQRPVVLLRCFYYRIVEQIDIIWEIQGPDWSKNRGRPPMLDGCGHCGRDCGRSQRF